MKTSESIENIATALHQAQHEMGNAKMNAVNPFLKNKYADLGSIIEAAKPALYHNGLSYVQMPSGNDSLSIGLTTRLMHISGEWIEETFYMPIPDNEKGKSVMQIAGSAITYARRYALASMLGIVADEDTDGNAPPAKTQKKQTKSQQKAQPQSDDAFKQWYFELPDGAKAAYKAQDSSEFIEAVSYIERYGDNPNAAKNAVEKFVSLDQIDFTPKDREAARIRVMHWKRVNAYAKMRNAGMESARAVSGALAQVPSVE